jgi:iron complex outermembrane receptor protein
MKAIPQLSRAYLLAGSTMLAIASVAASSPTFAQAVPVQATQPTTPAPEGPNGAAQTSTVADPNGQAGSNVNSQGEPVQDTGDVVVTGSRIARNGFDAPTPVNVVDAQEVKLSGNLNIERTLQQIPQTVASQLGGATSNTVPGGYADVNLRGFGSTRNLVLVNGRRFAIFGPEQVVDLNTIPSTLIARTEIVTGGSSAVYGSDAITGVVNFIMRNDFEGVEARGQVNLAAPTATPTYNVDLTVGGNFADGRGNVVVSANYLDRGSITRGQRGDFAFLSLADACVVKGTASATGPGTPFTPPAGQGCVAGGGELGFVASGSGDIPNGRFSGIPSFGGTNAALNAAYAAAGLTGLGGRGFTFNDAGTAARVAITPQDDFNLGPDNYLIQPQKRWMINSFAHYDFTDAITGYAEFHYSNNEVSARLAPTNVGAPTLFNVNNPYLTPALREVFRQLDLAETGTATVVSGTATRTTTPGDGLALVTAGRRYVEVGPRQATERRNVFRVAGGLRGDLGSASDDFLTDLKWDAYYTYSRSENTLLLQNALSRSRLQASLLSNGTAAPVCNIFGGNVTEACASAIRINATNSTIATQQVAQASLTGNLFRLPAGPVGFSGGYEWRNVSASFSPDSFLASGDVAGFNPGLPTSGKVTVNEGFGEVRVPLIHNTPLIDSLAFNGAFRYSKYSLEGVGGQWTYSAGLDWRVIPDMTLRGQYQRAIRAPNVGELYGGINRVVGAATDPCSSRAPASQQTAAVRAVCIATGVPAANVFTLAVQPNNIIPADFGGNPNLGAEKSNTYTAGAVFTPRFAPGLYLSVDYFNIDLEGAIAALGGGLQNSFNLCYLTLQDASSEYCRAFTRDPRTGELNDPFVARILNANTGSLKTSGIDFAGRYRVPLGWNNAALELNSSYTYLIEFTSTPVAAFPNIQNKCAGAFGTTCGQPLPYWRGTSRATLNFGDFSISARHRYIGPVTTDRYLVPVRQNAATAPPITNFAFPKLNAQHYLDLSFSATVGRTVEFFGGVNNVLDNNPPITTQGPNSNTYSATYDVLGPEVFLGATVKF